MDAKDHSAGWKQPQARFSNPAGPQTRLGPGEKALIKWCAYCQHFIHECRPFDDYQISHGICQACAPTVATFSPEDKDSLKGITRFFDALREVALSGSTGNVADILRESRQLGIRPLDLMMGILQPLLAEIGDLWAENRITWAVEHRFSVLVGALLTDVRKEGLEATGPQPTELVLVNARHNDHTLGLQMAELYFATHGIPTITVVPGLPTAEILELLCLHRPLAVGFSLGLQGHVAQVQEVAAEVRSLPFVPPRILVGGPAARSGLDLKTSLGLTICSQLDEALALLREPGFSARL
jgi:methanogenic corrinoid protein MtbC1